MIELDKWIEDLMRDATPEQKEEILNKVRNQLNEDKILEEHYQFVRKIGGLKK